MNGLMRRMLLCGVAAFSFWAAAGAAEGRTSVVRGAGGRRGGPTRIIKMRRREVSRPVGAGNADAPAAREGRFRGPRRDGAGAPITQRAAVAPPAQHVAVVRDPALGRNIVSERRVEVVPNRYYWHSVNGLRYAHFYDRRRHWYGFYHGPSFYWTTFYGDHWWWFDAHFGRWTYWWDGYWWWPSPAGALYVYVDNDYYPYDGHGVTVRSREEEPSPAAGPPAGASGRSWKSPDGRRMVQMAGDDAEAFLYDVSSGRPAFLKYLGKNVSNARFSGGTDGKPLRILLDYGDGAFALFTEDGDAVEEDVAPSTGTPPSPPADAAPPPPPGQ